MQQSEKIWIHMVPVLCYCVPKHYARSLPAMNTWVCCVPNAACAINNTQPCFICGCYTAETYRRTAEGSSLFHWTANRPFHMFYDTEEKRAVHSWVIVLDGGPGVCKASLGADGYKPLWLYSLHRQTLNQVEHRLHGKTWRLRVQILV